MREPLLIEFGNYVCAQGRDIDETASPAYVLFSDEKFVEMQQELQGILRRDRETFKPESLQTEVAAGIRHFQGCWFQRIDFPAQNLSTVSDRDWVLFDEGGVNTLGGRLSSEDACLLRPWPKWLYVRPLLPDLTDKSIMEVGCANGFFPFRFAELGAKRVTGVEFQRRRHESSVWANQILGWKNLEFKHADFLVDYTIEPHDIIFVSEVVNHMLCPLWGLTRLVALAKEMLILDTGVFESPQHTMELSTGWMPDGKTFSFLSFQISDGLICSYLKLLGLRADEIVKFVEPGAGHILYRINTKQLHERRANGELPENQRRSLTVDLTFPK